MRYLFSCFIYIYLITLFPAMSMAQKKIPDYKKDWDEVTSLTEKGLTASAQKKVSQILHIAVRENNSPQQIKAALFLMNLNMSVSETAAEGGLKYFDSLYLKTKEPVKSMLLSLKADLQMAYYSQNKYRIGNITQRDEETGNNIETWSGEKIKKEILENYQHSLSLRTELGLVSLDAYMDILTKGTNTKGLRPTLYDFLVHRALNGLGNLLNTGVRPIGAFTLDSKDYFESAAQFISLPVSEKWRTDVLAAMIKIYQDILAFHLKDTDPSALIDVDLARLKFIRQYAYVASVDDYFETALLTLETRYNNLPILAEIMAERATFYYDRGKVYDPVLKSGLKNEIKRSFDLCQSIIKKYPNSYGGKLAQNLIITITRPDLQINTEMVVIPNHPFKALITFNNIEVLYSRIYKVSVQELRDFKNRYYNQDELKKFFQRAVFKESTVTIPKTGDYLEHKTEIPVEGLPMGNYVLVISNDSTFSINTSLIIAKPVYSSDLAVVYDNEKNVNVVSRTDGRPIQYARIQMWVRKYNSKSNGYEWLREGGVAITDENGHAEMSGSTDEYYYGKYLEVSTSKDLLAIQESFYLNRRPEPDINKKDGFIFTDRAIYRPGQKVFVKGLLYTLDANQNKTVAANVKSEISLTDANGKKVKDIQVSTNEFGSYTAEFILPGFGLTGIFTLTDSFSNIRNSIRVEEYKRPKFKVTLDQPKDNFRVGDSVTIRGNAMAYAGNSISGSVVTYHITREPRFPEWWYGYRHFQPAGSRAEIANGQTATDEAGNFSISFNALADESIDKSTQPRFTYQVTADVTDVNGETRSSELSLTAAYQSMQLEVVTPEKITSDSLNNIKIFNKNFAGNSVPALINTKLFYLKDPHKLYKKRYWDNPDVFSISKEKHDKLFPFDPYQNEDKISNWEIERKMLDRTDSSSESGKYTLGFSQLPSGWYKLIASAKDISGDTIRVEKILMITDGNGNFSGTRPPISITSDRETIQPGEKGTISISSGFDQIFTINTRNTYDKKEISYSGIRLGDPKKISLVADSSDLGGIGYAAVTVMNNRIYAAGETIKVPYLGKELDIRYESFRDKLEPGAKETWMIHVSEKIKKGRPVEILANMYDASLDQITGHNWQRPSLLWPDNPYAASFTGLAFNSDLGSVISNAKQPDYKNAEKVYPNYLQKLWLNFRRPYYFMKRSGSREMEGMVADQSAPVMAVSEGASNKNLEDGTGIPIQPKPDEKTTSPDSQNEPADNQVPLRSNFNETAFFFPQLKTDQNGNTTFSFTMPEALTQWKLMTLAHTPDLASGYDERFVITQKKLMVQPNLPRFVREGDRLEIPVKIVNLSDKELTGTAGLELFDLANGKPVDGWFQNQFPNQYFSVAPTQSVVLYFPVSIPINFNSALTWKIKAATSDKSFTDGETDALPVLSNRVLVTETLPMYSSTPGSKNYTFQKLVNQDVKSSISSYRYSIEYSSNPAWYAVQALPYLMEFPYECVEQTFNRYYANSIASGIINKYPKIKSVFEQWKTKDSSALLSNLEKNQELKSALLEETPWVMQAKNESERKQRIASLFNLEKLSAEQYKALEKVIDAQQADGGFSWFMGGEPNRYMSQYILTGIGHLIKLGVLDEANTEKINTVLTRGIQYADHEMMKEYQELRKSKHKLTENHLSYLAIQYLYLRSFFPNWEVPAQMKPMVKYYQDQAKKYWLTQSKYLQAMTALALGRMGEQKAALGIVKSLKENALFSDEMGMYWAEFNRGGYYWYQAPIESQAMMIEAFTEIEKDAKTINALKTWLLRQKQTQDWGTTRATAEACYALLIGGDDWLTNTQTVTISLDGKPVDMPAAEAGTGYQKKIFTGEEINPSMGKIRVDVPEQGKHGTAVTWGAAYWQYFENQDKISASSSGISVKKEMLIEKNSDKGPVLVALKEGEEYKVGDKIKIRLEIRVDRNLEFVHLKDTRPAALEPGNVLSGYQWQNGLGYYQSTRDASTNYFFPLLPKGTYVFEYPAFISHRGDFSSGMASLQCMYAPEFSGHSNGQRMEVGN